jgi:hypothetical protein
MRKALVAVAIGLGLSALFITVNVVQARADTCVNRSKSYSWGTWPYDQQVIDHTYVCYKATTGVITYRATNVDANSTLCDVTSTYTYRIAGGTGNYYVEWIDGAHFTCPTNLPGIFVHRDDSMGVEFALTGTLPNPTIVYKIFSPS